MNVIVKNGKTEYSILLPQKATERETYAAEQLAYFFGQCCGSSPQIENEVIKGEKYIAVGRTALTKKYSEEKRLDAFRIESSADLITVCGDDDDGTLYGVYELLESFFGVRFYAPDETFIPKREKIEIDYFSKKYIPDFESRMLGYYGTMSDSAFADKRRVLASHCNWGLWSHTHFIILPPEKYYNDHSDWYSPDKTQLCLCNEEMRKEFVKNLFEIIMSKPEAEYFMLGQEDEDTFCDCPICAESNKKYGESGTMMRFVNAVAKETDEMIKKSSTPERKVLYVTFAYCKTERPPVKPDEENNSFVLLDGSLKATENVGVMFAPIFTCFTHDFMNKACNTKVRNNLLGWSEVSEKLLVWCYSSNYAGYLVPLNNFGTYAETYKIFKKYGVVYLFNQGIFNSLDTFHYLKIYFNSVLMWNVMADADKLIDDFIENYYKAAAPYIKTYYNAVIENYRKMDGCGDFHCYCTWNGGAKTLTKDVFGEDFLKKCAEYIDDAVRSLSVYPDKEFREKIEIRVLRESLFLKYMTLQLYSENYTKEQLSNMIDKFEALAKKSSVTRFKTGGGVKVGGPEMHVKIEEWKQKLLGENA